AELVEVVEELYFREHRFDPGLLIASLRTLRRSAQAKGERGWNLSQPGLVLHTASPVGFNRLHGADAGDAGSVPLVDRRPAPRVRRLWRSYPSTEWSVPGHAKPRPVQPRRKRGCPDDSCAATAACSCGPSPAR